MTDLEARLRRLPAPAFVADLSQRLTQHTARLAPTSPSPGPRIGVVADTHCARAEDLPDDVLAAFSAVDLIVHCGDIGAIEVLERLATVAPVVAVRSGGDAPADGRHLFDGPRMVRAGDLLVGIVSHLEASTREEAAVVFGTDVDVVLTGTTHVAQIAELEGADGVTTVVNPGSPTLPFGGTPSVALIEAVGDTAQASIINIRTQLGEK